MNKNHQNLKYKFFYYSEPPTRKHLKNVYGCLSLSTLLAAVGVYVHVYTSILKAGLLSYFGVLGLMAVLLCTPDSEKNRFLRFGYLLGIAFLTGLGLGPLIIKVITIDPRIVLTALISKYNVYITIINNKYNLINFILIFIEIH